MNRKADKTLPTVLVTIGDPSSSGPELAVRTALNKDVRAKCFPIVIGSPLIVNDAIKRIKLPAAVRLVESCNSSLTVESDEEVLVLPCGELNPKDYTKGEPSPKCGDHAVSVSREAARLTVDRRFDAICSGPTSKVSLQMAGYDFGGMSEIFRRESNATHYRSLLVLDEYRIMLATSHVALKRVPELISIDLVMDQVSDLREGLTSLFRITNPKIGVAGLNPHGGEGGLYGTEEENVIVPTIKALKEQGMTVFGPISPDFLVAQFKTLCLDGALAMYHDQAHIPLKALGMYRAATLLLGLPIIRTSVAHGTVYGKARMGTADPSGMIHAVLLAAKLGKISSLSESSL